MVTAEYKNRVLAAMESARDNFMNSDTAFAKSLGINGSVYSRIKGGQTDGMLSDAKWLQIGRILDVKVFDKKWITARTEVYAKIESDLINCQQHSTALIMVDECGIGKTYCAKQVARQLKNAFYIDCSQAKTKQQFVRTLARAVGIDSTGRYIDVKKDLKYTLTYLERALVILDEAGDLEYNAFLELKELWNATEGTTGWYMMGADGLRAKIQRGISNKKVGYREIFDRFNNKFMKAVPSGTASKEEFYAVMIADVLAANLPESEHHQINKLVKQIMGTDSSELGGLRRAETFVNLIKNEHTESTNAG